ncbi:hypothetical protein GQ473_05775 [archaeon]|nr:hypothetical protein [archaeon]
MILLYALSVAVINLILWFVLLLFGLKGSAGVMASIIFSAIIIIIILFKNKNSILAQAKNINVHLPAYLKKNWKTIIIIFVLFLLVIMVFMLVGVINVVTYGIPFVLISTISYFIILAYQLKDYADVFRLYILLVIIILLAPIFYAWTPIISDKTQNVQAQLGIGDKTDGAFAGATAGLADIWLMLTDPVAWQENKNNDKGKQEGGTSALEITKIYTQPSIVMPQDEYTLLFELKNTGENKATGVYVGTQVGERAEKNNAHISVDIDGDGDKEALKVYYMPIDDVYPGAMRLESFDVTAPNCGGTFETTAYVEYTYEALATTNIEFITKQYYNELLNDNKIQWKDELSTSSAGPFKVTVKTQYPQPIPVSDNDGNPKEFKIYFSLVNEREGQAFVNNINFILPKDLEISKTNDDIAKDCDFIAVKDSDNNDIPGRYKLDLVNKNDLKKKLCVEAKETSSFSCTFNYKSDEIKNIEQIKTHFIKTNVNYTFTYPKRTTITVKNNVPGYSTCKELSDADKTEYKETTTTDGDITGSKIIDILGDVLYSECDNKNLNNICDISDVVESKKILVDLMTACFNEWDGAKAVTLKCGSVNLNIKDDTCSDVKITAEEITNYFRNEFVGTEGIFKTSVAPKVKWSSKVGSSTLQSNKQYRIDISYTQQACDQYGINMDILSAITNDNCDLEDGKACTENAQCVSNTCTDGKCVSEPVEE